MKNILSYLFLMLALAACTSKPEDALQVKTLPKIYPDYFNVTVPAEIAPLSFNYTGGDYSELYAEVKGSRGGSIESSGDYINFDIDEWHSLLSKNKGGSLSVTLYVKNGGDWTQYKDFTINVSTYPLDEWGLTYRRIAPGYEVYSRMGIFQRNLSNFDETAIIQNTQAGGQCINCHTANRTNPTEFTFHVRGKKGATMVQMDGKRVWLNTQIDTVRGIGSCVYPYWHPTGKYIAYSTNTTRQAFHVIPSERIEVFDLASDVMVYNTATNQVLLSPQLMTKDFSETYPVFSPDGRTLYFCTCKTQEYPKAFKQTKYNLCKIAFDPDKGTFGNKVDTIVDAVSMNKSIAFPRPSYDGKYIMFTMADYGCFPIWHKEADLWMLNLKTGKIAPVKEVNSNNTESFHNWNVNSHWFVFSSRRGDGLYTRLYLASIDDKGRVTKPFLLPQENPWEYYEKSIYSYNIPDFTKTPVDFDVRSATNEIMSDKRTIIKEKDVK